MKQLTVEEVTCVSGGDDAESLGNAYADCMANSPMAASPEQASVNDAICAIAAGQEALGNGGDSGGKVICTELCRNGDIPHDVWMADIRYSRTNFSDRTMRGYHAWGVPYVKLMRKYPLFAALAKHPTRWFAEDIAYRMGVRDRRNLKGWMLREVFFRPLCSLIGVFAESRDWQALFVSQRPGT